MTPSTAHPNEAAVTALILPGLWNSGPEHWQSHWERMDPTSRRVAQDEWETPALADWVHGLSRAVRALGAPAVLVAHSSACALVAHWAERAPPEELANVRAALLVASSNPAAPSYPVGPTGFAPMPRPRLPFPSVVVASRDDEYVSLARASASACGWGSRLVDAGNAGHLNGRSGLGTWPAGYALLEFLRPGAR